jgi:hypothetical protein
MPRKLSALPSYPAPVGRDGITGPAGCKGGNNLDVIHVRLGMAGEHFPYIKVTTVVR